MMSNNLKQDYASVFLEMTPDSGVLLAEECLQIGVEATMPTAMGLSTCTRMVDARAR